MSVYVVQLFVYKSRCDAINIQRRELTLRGALTVNDHTTIPTKCCTRCGKEYPATLEYFTSRAKGRFGLASECKDCEHIRQAAYRAVSKDKKRERNQRYYAENKAREKKRIKRYYEQNKDKFHQRYIATRDRKLEKQKQWARANSENIRIRAMRRRSRVKSADGDVTTEEVMMQYKRQRTKCYYCGCLLMGNYHIDHVIPISRGGRNAIDNIVLACPSCNREKNARLPHEWAKGGRLL